MLQLTPVCLWLVSLTVKGKQLVDVQGYDGNRNTVHMHKKTERKKEGERDRDRERKGGCMLQAPKPLSSQTFVDDVKNLKMGRLFM